MKAAKDYINEMGYADGDQFSSKHVADMINKARIEALTKACNVVKTYKVGNSGSWYDAAVDRTPIIELIKQCL